jgi:general secretion pathway protein H
VLTRNAKLETRNVGEAGFTLIELLVVIVLLVVAAGIVIPRLPAPEGTRLKSSARNLASGIRFLSDRAIITKNIYRLHLNIADNSVDIARVSTSGQEQPPDDEFMTRKLLEEGIAIEDVTTQGLGKRSEGDIIIPFGPAGASEPLLIHLKGGSQQYTVIAYPFGGKVEVLEGYKEMEVPT